MDAPVLVLNANFEPINVCNTRRALGLIFLGKADLVMNGRGSIQTVKQTIPIPFGHPLGTDDTPTASTGQINQKRSLPERPIYLPVLRKTLQGSDRRPCMAQASWGRTYLDKCGSSMPILQSPQGWQETRRGQYDLTSHSERTPCKCQVHFWETPRRKFRMGTIHHGVVNKKIPQVQGIYYCGGVNETIDMICEIIFNLI